KFPNIEWEINQTVVKGRNDLTASGANGFYALYESGMELQNETQVLQEVQKYLMIPTSLKMADPFYDLELILSSTLELLKIKRIVEGLPAFSLSTQVVAAKLSVSTKTLARRLSKQSQWTPAKLLWRIKYKQAAELFLLTNLTVSEICQKLGFEDESNFRRGFKQSSGMTPGEYQQKFKVTHTKLQIG
ncbi:MAG: AraC family transcriptional regulator, partial [Candidatus Caldatribacteriota bacterium]